MFNNMKTGIEQITEERVKQISKYGYTPYHDTGYNNKHLLLAALSYLKTAIGGEEAQMLNWPWEPKYFKDEGYVENLKKAGALIAAELDRLNVS